MITAYSVRFARLARQASVAALLTASTLGAGTLPQAHAQFTWQAGAGLWTDAGKWVGGQAPPVGGSPTTALSFTGQGLNNFTYTSTNNLAGEFAVNRLSSVGTYTGGIEVESRPTSGQNGLRFTGNTPTITQTGLKTLTLGGSVVLAPTTGAFTVNGGGYGSVSMSAFTSGTTQTVINLTGIFRSAPQGFAGFTGATYSVQGGINTVGDVRLQSGNLRIFGNGQALGVASNKIYVDGVNNSLRTDITTPVLYDMVLNQTLNLVTTFQIPDYNGVFSGVGGISLYGFSGTSVRLLGNNTYTGNTLLTGQEAGSAPTRLQLTNNGRLAQTGRLTLHSGGELTLVNSTFGGIGNVLDRVNDAAPVILAGGGSISFTGAGGATASGETFGAVTLRGANTITFTNSNNVLQMGTLSRDAGSLLQLRSPAGVPLGGGAAGAGRNNVFFAGGLPIIAHPNAPTNSGVYTGVVPFAIGAESATSSRPAQLVTYDANGARFLAASEYSEVGAGGSLVPFANNRVSDAPAPIAGTQSVNALITAGNGLNPFTGLGAVTFTGNGTIAIHSGVLAAHSATTTTFNGVSVDFGANPGYITGALTVTGGSTLTGSAGVAVASSTLTFSNPGGNPFTGGLTIGSPAFVLFTQDNQLGAAGGNVTFAGGTLQSSVSGTTVAAGRTITVGEAGGTLLGGSGTTVAASLAGSGALHLRGTVRLSGDNSAFTGSLRTSNTLEIASPTALGAGGTFYPGETVRTIGSQTVANPMIVESRMVVEASANESLAFTGEMRGFGNILREAGNAGTVRFAGSGDYAGQMILRGGTTLVDGAIPSAGLIGVENTAIFSGTGTVGEIIVATGGVVRPGGQVTPGLLSASNFYWNAGGILDMRLGSGNVSDTLALSGALLRNGGTGAYLFRFADTGGATANGGEWTLFTFGQNTNFSASDFSFTGIVAPEGRFEVRPNAVVFRINGAVIPETPTGLLTVLGLLGTVAGYRRRSHAACR